MATRTIPESASLTSSVSEGKRSTRLLSTLTSVATANDWSAVRGAHALVPFATVFVAYYIAGVLGQATTNIRSSNLGPVWPAYGIALAAALTYGYRIWPALAGSAFLVAVLGSVTVAAAAGQAIGATLAALTGTFLLRRIANFDPALSRLRDALGLIVFGAFGSALISAVIGVFSLYATGIHAYSGLPSAWLIYWLGDSTGVLLVTPLVFAAMSLKMPSRARALEFATLMALLTAACFAIFGDWDVIPIRLHVMAFAVLPFVMWGAIGFGVGGAATTVFWTATLATVLTALGSGPFAGHNPFINAVLLDVLFIVLSVSGLTLAAVIAERERAELERERLIREQAAMEARHALAAMNRKLIDAQEQERARIARELHDNISQRLALLMFELNAPTVENESKTELQNQISELVADVHALSHNLHSSKLDLLGIATGIQLFCKRFGEQHRLHVALDAHDVPDHVAPEAALCLYRILQEALQNAAKHSGAREVKVRLWGTGGEIHLLVRDRGVGFDVDASKRSPGIGLVSMQERIQLVSGDLSIESAPQCGTTVHARVPLKVAAAAGHG